MQAPFSLARSAGGAVQRPESGLQQLTDVARGHGVGLRCLQQCVQGNHGCIDVPHCRLIGFVRLCAIAHCGLLCLADAVRIYSVLLFKYTVYLNL